MHETDARGMAHHLGVLRGGLDLAVGVSSWASGNANGTGSFFL